MYATLLRVLTPVRWVIYLPLKACAFVGVMPPRPLVSVCASLDRPLLRLLSRVWANGVSGS